MGYWQWQLPRPTAKVGEHDHPWYEGSGTHWAYLVAWGSVAVQWSFRLWRFQLSGTFWRSYHDE
jgi:hypothetical protein